jgi:ABC-type multidrug transport system fused ATPase/permease subunit
MSNLAVFRSAWALLRPAQRRHAGWLVLVSLFMAFSTLGGIAAIVPFFAVLADDAAIERHAALAALYRAGGFAERGTFLLCLGAGFIGAVLVSNLVNLLGARALNHFALRLGRDFHVTLFEEYLHRDYAFHLRHPSASLANNVINETARAVSGLVQGGLSLLVNLLACVVIVCSVLLVNPALALAAAALFCGSYVAIYFGLRARLGRAGQLEGEMWDARSRTLSESFGAIKEILLRGAQRRFRDDFARQSDAITRVSTSVWTLSQAPRHVLECVTALGLVVAALWLQRGSQAGDWLASLSFLGFAAYRLLPALQQAFVALARVRAHRGAFLRIAPDLARGRAALRPASPEVAERLAWQPRPARCIAFHDVSFRFAPEAPWVLRGLRFEIRPGELVGIVGPNGAGKTTLADLLLGLLSPAEGFVEVDGIRLDEHNLPLWRRRVAYVPQHIFLLDGSIRDNIVLGCPDAGVDEARLQRAVRIAGLDHYIAELPGGLAHCVGERGARLSGGQRQRIGICRAFYQDAPVLLLDEATSALDEVAERALAAELLTWRGSRTVVIITHREATLAVCERVLRLEGGRVTQLAARSPRVRNVS